MHLDQDIDCVTAAGESLYPECLIINRPDLKSMPLVLGEGLITLLFWGFWFYLWLPIISLLAWIVGFKVMYRQLILLGGFDGFIRQLNIFTFGVVLVSGAIAAWSFYNLKRYGTYRRRQHVQKTDMHRLAAALNLSNRELVDIQNAKRVVFSFNEDDSIKEIHPLPSQQAE